MIHIFQGDWDYAFNPNDTKYKDFYLSIGEQVEVKMMYQKNTFKYMENPALQIKVKKVLQLIKIFRGNVN